MPENKIGPAPSPLPHLQVVAAVIMRDDTILCAQRKAGGELSLKWEFPGGKVEPGESHQQALEREIDEELGLGIKVGEHIHTVDHRYSAFSISLHAYRATVRSGVPVCTEHLAIRWLRVDELRMLDWTPADLPIVELLMTMKNCPFCSVPAEQHFYDGPLVFGIWDSHPASPGHALLITKRHVPTWFDATQTEQAELLAATAQARNAIEATHTPDGYNLGINIGAAAGQTVFHLHVHIIPRYAGDVARPRGGVRHVVPGRGSIRRPMTNQRFKYIYNIDSWKELSSMKPDSKYYSIFEYQYRDGGNFKSCDYVILEGQVTDTIFKALTDCLIDGMWFVASQVGLPDLFEGVQKWGPSDLDVSWHEFVELRPTSADIISTKPTYGKISDLLDAFKNAKGHWKLV